MRPCRPSFILGFLCSVSALWAQSTVPTISQPIPAQSLVMEGPAVTLDLRNFIAVPGVSATNEIVQFATYAGRFNVELRRDAAPRHVENFLAYVRDNAYGNSFFHRSASFDATAVSILQGGGYQVSGSSATAIPRRAPVPLEYNLANARGTLAAARTTDVNSATSEWYFNVRDNSSILNQSNGGGYTVFGRVLGTGLTVLDQIAALPRFNIQPDFPELPMRSYTSGQIVPSVHLAIVNGVSLVTLFPTGGGPSAIEFSIQNSNPAAVSTLLSGSTLTIAPGNGGSATVTVRAVDTNGNAAQTTFVVDVAAVQPAFLTQPTSQTAAIGSTVVLRATASATTQYQWRRNGTDIVGATNATLVLPNVSGPDAGEYQSVARNNFGEVKSDAATLTVAAMPEATVGRLANLSVLTSAGAGTRALTVGASVGPLTSPASLPLVVRAVGPTLSDTFGVGGVLPDPVMTFHAVGVAQPIGSNDNWEGAVELSSAFASVGAFALPAASLDSAIARPAPGLAVGGYTVQVTGKGGASGLVLAEIYDAAAGERTATTPRLTNLSVLKQLDAGETLTAGFVIQGGSSRTVLVRAVGPGLEPFGLGDRMADPTLALFRGSTRIADNDNWAGDLHLRNMAVAVGAFPVENASSRDAMLLLSLPPGDYSARVSDVSGAGGNVIVEVYEVR